MSGSANGTARPRATALNYTMPDLGHLWEPQLTFLPNGWGVVIASIDPELGQAMLNLNRSDNRNKQPHSIRRYADDMREGIWRLTHQGVAFDRWGMLCDGQNRLRAGVEAGVPFNTLVFFGVGDRPEMGVMDTGKIRSASDASACLLGQRVDAKAIATFRAFLAGPASVIPVYTHGWLLGELAKLPSFVPAYERMFHRGAPAAPFRGAVMRAYYHHDPEDVERFSDIVCERRPFQEQRDVPAILLKKFIGGFHSGRGGVQAQTEIYRKSQRALAAYFGGEKIDKLYASTEDLFPLPTEEQAEARNERERAAAVASVLG